MIVYNQIQECLEILNLKNQSQKLFSQFTFRIIAAYIQKFQYLGSSVHYQHIDRNKNQQNPLVYQTFLTIPIYIFWVQVSREIKNYERQEHQLKLIQYFFNIFLDYLELVLVDDTLLFQALKVPSTNQYYRQTQSFSAQRIVQDLLFSQVAKLNLPEFQKKTEEQRKEKQFLKKLSQILFLQNFHRDFMTGKYQGRSNYVQKLQCLKNLKIKMIKRKNSLKFSVEFEMKILKQETENPPQQEQKLSQKYIKGQIQTISIRLLNSYHLNNKLDSLTESTQQQIQLLNKIQKNQIQVIRKIDEQIKFDQPLDTKIQDQ